MSVLARGSEAHRVNVPLESVNRDATLKIMSKIDNMISLPEETAEPQVLSPLDKQVALFCSIFKGEIVP